MMESKTAYMESLPVEILLEIYSHLDVSTIFNVSATSKTMRHLFQERRVEILIPILSREFSPFDELLQVYTAKSVDIVGSATYHPRRIVFQRSAMDKGVHIASEVPAKASYKGSGVQSAASSASQPTILTEDDMDKVLTMCRLVRQWEQIFPQMRWFQEPENCRTLRPHEMARFRRAFYRWWLYGVYFHGELPRPRIGLPEPLVEDIRTSQLRYYSTSELLELMDLLEAIKDLICHYICPRLDPSSYDLENPDDGEELPGPCPWDRIISTYAKLGPEELMHYFDNIYSYPRKRLITEIRLQRPGFTFDQESIQLAVQCVLTERRLWDPAPSFAENSSGGILDFDDERDLERAVFGSDASRDGNLPAGLKAIHSQSRFSPRGDDGSYLEEIHARKMLRNMGRTAIVHA